MTKKIIIAAIVFSQAIASAAPIINLKDYQVESLSSTSTQATFKGEKVVVNVLGNNKYEVNGSPFTISNTDTLDQAYRKVENAYRRSKKRTASLDEFFLSKAHAFAFLPMALGAAFFGGAMVDATHKTNKTKFCSTETEPQPTPEGASSNR
jgi:hypothetical protein